jgi:hypothetical protein
MSAAAAAAKSPPFSCKNCSAEHKKRRGCIRPTSKKHPAWISDICPFCEGENDKCKHCKGSNRIPMYRCPRSSARDFAPLLPFFIRYRDYGEFPNGKPGMINQPVGFVRACNLYFALIERFLPKG